MVMLQLRYCTPNHAIKILKVAFDADEEQQCWYTNEVEEYSDIPPHRCYHDPWVLANDIMKRGHTGGTAEGIENELHMLAAFQRTIERTRGLEDRVLEYEIRDEVKYKEDHPDEF